MVQPNQLKDVSLQAVRKTQETLREIPRVVISAEERLRQRVQAILRVTLATVFFFISGLISLGANVTMAFAKKVSPEQSQRDRKSKTGQRTKLHFKHISKPADKKPALSTHHSTATTGTASWYGGRFHNRRTASGVRFNTNSFMAAHRTLPFGTLVRVKNLTNGKTCVVQVTDRGPYVGNRVIDVSKAAAEKLGFLAAGTAKVELEVIAPPGVFANDIAANQLHIDRENFKPEGEDAGKDAISDQDMADFPSRLDAILMVKSEALATEALAGEEQ